MAVIIADIPKRRPVTSGGAPAVPVVGRLPAEPVCRHSTVPVSSHAAMIGSQWSVNTDGNPSLSRDSGKVTADSGGCRDKLVESFCWSIPCEGLSWAFVEESSDGVELVLAVDRQVGALGKELAD